MVETGVKTKSMRMMTMKRIQPKGNIRELISKRPPRDVAALVIKMKARMRLQGENEGGQPTKLKEAEPKVAVRKTVMKKKEKRGRTEGKRRMAARGGKERLKKMAGKTRAMSRIKRKKRKMKGKSTLWAFIGISLCQ